MLVVFKGYPWSHKVGLSYIAYKHTGTHTPSQSAHPLTICIPLPQCWMDSPRVMHSPISSSRILILTQMISLASTVQTGSLFASPRQPPVLISNGLPPLVPATLIKRVEQGLFIKMTELSPSYLDSAELNTGSQHGSHKQLPEVLDIVEWIPNSGLS